MIFTSVVAYTVQVAEGCEECGADTGTTGMVGMSKVLTIEADCLANAIALSRGKIYDDYQEDADLLLCVYVAAVFTDEPPLLFSMLDDVTEHGTDVQLLMADPQGCA